MALRESMESEGNWLFRWRSILPPVVAVIAVVGTAVHDVYLEGDRPTPTRVEEAAWILLGLAGLAVRVAVAGYVPKHTSGRNTAKGQVADALNTGGLYSLVRHPLYLGNYLLWTACIGVASGIEVAFVTTLIFWLFYERVMLAEEAFLRAQFGDAFVAWAARTPAFVPRLRGWRPADLPFCPRTAIKREYTSAAAFLCVFALFAGAARAVAAASPRLDPVWVSVLGTALAVYVGLRVLRKQRVFSVEGR